MKRASFGKRRDENERPIIDALRAVGATVEQLSGPNVPDLLVGYCGGNWLFEIKAARGKTTKGQESWLLGWMGSVFIVRTPEEALRRIGVKVKEVRLRA